MLTSHKGNIISSKTDNLELTFSVHRKLNQKSKIKQQYGLPQLFLHLKTKTTLLNYHLVVVWFFFFLLLLCVAKLLWDHVNLHDICQGLSPETGNSLSHDNFILLYFELNSTPGGRWSTGVLEEKRDVRGLITTQRVSLEAAPGSFPRPCRLAPLYAHLPPLTDVGWLERLFWKCHWHLGEGAIRLMWHLTMNSVLESSKHCR